jgi:hypothetical protein
MFDFFLGFAIGLIVVVLLFYLKIYLYRYFIKENDQVFFYINDIRYVGKVTTIMDGKIIVLSLHGKKFALEPKDLYEI